MELSHERIPELYKYHYDIGKSAIVDGLGNEVSTNEILDLLSRADPKFTQGIGSSTAARAIATRAALRGDGSDGTGRASSLQHSGLEFSKNYKERLLYSKTSEKERKEE